jgi:hypothetical protein
MVDFVVVRVVVVKVVVVRVVVVMVGFVVYLMIHFGPILILLFHEKLEVEMCYYTSIY